MRAHEGNGSRAWLQDAGMATFALVVCISMTLAYGADFPVKPVTLIAPTVPGGAMDGTARLLAQNLSPRLGQPVVVESRPGVGGTLGTLQVAKAAPDGHTLVIVADAYLTVSPRLLRGVELDAFRDLAPVIEVGSSPLVLVANPALGVKSLAEYVTKVRAQPGRVTYASGGVGSPHHFAMAILEQQLGLKQNHLPYKGAPAGFVDVLGGHADCMFISMSTAEPHIKNGKLIALGVSSPKPLPEAPSIAAISDVAPGYESGFWFAIFAPARTPASTVARLNRDLASVLAVPDVAQKMKVLGLTPTLGSTPESLAAKLRKEAAKMEEVIRHLGLKPE